MPLDFPNSPAVGQVYDGLWQWDGQKWVVTSLTSGGPFLPLAGGTLTGALTLAADPTAPLGAVTKQYVDAHASPFADAPSDGTSYGRNNAAWQRVLALAGGTLTGPLTLAADPVTALQAVTKQYSDTKLPLGGGSMTGPLTLAADPVAPLQAATKEYVDAHAAPSTLGSAPTIAALRAATTSTLIQNYVVVQQYYAGVYDDARLYSYWAGDSSSADNGGTVIIDASGRRWHLVLDGNPVTVKAFGARVNGTNDDTTFCQNADTWSRANNNYPIRFPAGITMASQLVVYSGSVWEGVGRAGAIAGQVGTYASKIMQLPGLHNVDLIKGNNSDANWGQGTVTNYVDGYTLRNLTIDGNWQGGGNSGGDGISIFGCKPIMENIFVTNCANNGIHTGWTSQDPPGICPGFDAWTMEGYFNNIQIDTCGQRGWWHDGPHDSIHFGVRIVDASRSANNTYDSLYADANSNGGLWFGSHFWCRHSSSGTATVRPQYGANLKAAPHFFNGCYFEGAYTPVGLGSSSTFDDGCVFLGAFGGTTIEVDGGTNRIRGSIWPIANGGTAATGILLNGSNAVNNDIDVQCIGQEAANISFNGSGGGNKIRMQCFNSTGVTYFGTPAPTDDMRLNINNSNSVNAVYSNSYLRAAVPASGAYYVPSGATVNVCSINLPTGGDWEIWATIGYTANGAINFQYMNNNVLVSGTTQTGADGLTTTYWVSGTITAGGEGMLLPAGHSVVRVAAPTQVILQASPSYTGASAYAYGNLHAKRL